MSPAYIIWQKKDQFLLAWLNSTLTDKILSTVYGQNHARQVFIHLANKFAPQSRSHISHLKRQLQILSQELKSCSDYLLTAKSWANQLAAAGKPVDDEDLISYVVSGVNNAYHPFITALNLTTRESPISFDDFQAELLNYEQLLDKQTKAVQHEGGQFAFFALPTAPVSSGGIISSSSPQYFTINHSPCQICGKTNHQAPDCYHCMDFSYQGRHPPSQLAALAAHTHVNTEWNDFGALTVVQTINSRLRICHFSNHL